MITIRSGTVLKMEGRTEKKTSPLLLGEKMERKNTEDFRIVFRVEMSGRCEAESWESRKHDEETQKNSILAGLCISTNEL